LLNQQEDDESEDDHTQPRQEVHHAPTAANVVVGAAKVSANTAPTEKDSSDEADSADDDSKQGKEDEEDDDLTMLPGPPRLSQNASQQSAQSMSCTMQPRMMLPPMQPMNLTQAWNRFHNPNSTNQAMAMRDHYLLTRPEYNAGLAACSNNAAPRPSFPNLTLIGAPPPAPAVDRTTNNRNTTARPPTAAAPARGAAMNNSNNVNGRSLAFRIPELLSLAKIMEEVQPIGAPSWQRVEADYNALYPDRPRTIDSLRRKFNWMKDSKIPTGDPTMPAKAHQSGKEGALSDC
jgi:hypothetical protein